jgi:hypothetical protein
MKILRVVIGCLMLVVGGCSSGAVMHSSTKKAMYDSMVEERGAAAGRRAEYVIIEKAGTAGGLTAAAANVRQSRGAEALPLVLRQHSVKASVSGCFAQVDLRERFENPSGGPVNAEYALPLGHQAVVLDAVITVSGAGGDREIRAIVRPREEAMRAFDAARRQGLKATLLTSEEGDRFWQHVSNVPAGGVVEARVRYGEILRWEGGAFVLEMGLPELSRVKWDISVFVAGGAMGPVGPAESGTHQIASEVTGQRETLITVGPAREAGASAFVLRIPYAGEQVRVGAFLGKPADGATPFGLLLIPAARGKGTEAVDLRIENAGELYPGKVTELRADQPVLVVGRTIAGQEVVIAGTVGGKAVRGQVGSGNAGEAIAAYWALGKIRALMADPTAGNLKEARNIALEHSLVTPLTALLSVDTVPEK